jgi:peptide-methionine (S)-S-oxide reductase
MSIETITVGGGCFWCVEAVFELVKGVERLESGYSNGQTLRPTYEQVCSGRTGHVEVLRIQFDTKIIQLKDILSIFFAIHDPTTLNQQGNDVGTQYRSGIYYENDDQANTARTLINSLTAQKIFDQPIVTEVKPLENYSAAESYHQNYFVNNPDQGYCSYVVAPKVAKFRKSFSNWMKS